MLGSTKTEQGYQFITYAPNAKEVKVYINGNLHNMENKEGYWQTEIQGVKDNTIYTYQIDSVRKCDPYAKKVIEINKSNPESVTYDSQYIFKNDRVNQPLKSIYEVYLRKIDGETYQEKAYHIVKHASEYSHIQIMPFNYTPNKKTLGYKTSTYFAPEHKYGDLDDFKKMIDILHENKFGVILDFSIFEFEEFSNTGLKMYDGTTLFERSDKKQHPIFTGFYFDIEKEFVKRFLKEVVKFLIHDLNADGIRIDGVNEVVFINKGSTQDVNQKGLLFIKEVINEVPEDRLIIADMLTHHKLKDLDLGRISGIEANMFMFQVQKILILGKEWFETNKIEEIKLLNNTIQLMFDNKYIGTINHDIHINGIDNEVTFGGLKKEKEFDLLKSLIYALPVPKQVYYSAKINKDYKLLIDNIYNYQFGYNIFEDGVIQFNYYLENKKFDIYFNLFEVTIDIYETTRKSVI